MSERAPALAEAGARLRRARKVALLTGAGISAESGVPTFRDAQTGLWARFRPEALATSEAFARDPELVWSWYAWRRALVESAVPNAGHRALVTLEERVPDCTLITQNVDHLHEHAGSRVILKLHGSLFANLRESDRQPVAPDDMTDDTPPRCRHTGQRIRPGVVWFGEALPHDILSAAEQAARDCDVFLSIGTSSMVEPAASLPLLALRSGACVIEVNPEATPLTPHCTLTLRGTAADILPALIAEAFPAA